MSPRQIASQLCVFSRPDFDDTAVKWGAVWTRNLIDQCGYSLIDLYKEKAVRSVLEETVKANLKAWFYIFGHGNLDCITGQNLQIIIDDDNIALFDEAWVHALSCEVFARLGLKFKHGSGYKKTYYFYISTYPNGVAEQYFRSDHAFSLAVWGKNCSKAEAQAALKQAYTDWFAKGIAGNEYLPWDRDAHVITGDPDAHWSAGPGIAKVEADFEYKGETPQFIGEMVRGENDVYSLKWIFPKEGVCKLRYRAFDTEGNGKFKETGDFTIKFPESPIEIEPIWPKGGETIEARSAEIKTAVRYLGP